MILLLRAKTAGMAAQFRRSLENWTGLLCARGAQSSARSFPNATNFVRQLRCRWLYSWLFAGINSFAAANRRLSGFVPSDGQPGSWTFYG